MAFLGLGMPADSEAEQLAERRIRERLRHDFTPEELAELERRMQEHEAQLEARKRAEAERKALEAHERAMRGSQKYAKAQAKRERKRQQRLARGGR
jgi:hypothetical protein